MASCAYRIHQIAMTALPGRPLTPTSTLALVLLAAALAGPAQGAPDPRTRLGEIALLAEDDNARARTILVHEGPTLIATAPYPVRIQYLRLLRRVQADAGNFRDAFETNELIIRLAKAERDPLNTALASLGRVLRLIENNDPAGALGLLETLGARYRALGSLEFTAGHEALYGMAYSAVGQHSRALGYFLRSLDLLRMHPELWSPREADIQLAMARMYVNARDPARALDTLREIRADNRRLPPRTAAAVAFFEGRALVAQDKLDDALVAFNRALDLAQQHELISTEANVLGNIADAHLKARRYREAEQAARAALSPAARSEDRISLHMAKANLGFALFAQGKHEGLVQVDEVIAAMRRAGAMSTVGRMLAEKSQALEDAGRYREALGVTREREAVTQQLALDERNKAVTALQEQFQSRERATQIESLRQDNAVKDAELRHRKLLQAGALFGASLAFALTAGVLWMYRKSVRTSRRLADLNHELAYRSDHDPLTGLFNRRSFQDRMRSRTGEAAPRLDAADCFTLLDIDHFKRINDEHGHAAGDAVLVEVGKRLRSAMRESDMVLRWGGEEFLVYSQGVTPTQQPLLVQRILDALAARPVVLDDGTELRISATAGAVSLPFEPDDEPDHVAQFDWEQAIALADRALYKGKEAGRNRGYIVAGMRRPEGALELDLVLPGERA